MRWQSACAALVLIAAALGCDRRGEEQPTTRPAATVARVKVDTAHPSPPPFDARLISLMNEGADDATFANPDMDYRFVLAITNNSAETVTAIRGAISVRSPTGTNILANHPFVVSDMVLSPGATERRTIDVPVAAATVERSALMFEVTGGSVR